MEAARVRASCTRVIVDELDAIFGCGSLRPVGTYLDGRRMRETMRYWETASPGQPAVVREFTRIWQAADKIVYSTTLRSVSSARTRIEHDFEPDAVRRLKKTLDQDITVGGADLAGEAMTAGLVDELRLFVVPVVVGGGKRALPDNVHLPLKLRDTRRFASGVMYLAYGLQP